MLQPPDSEKAHRVADLVDRVGVTAGNAGIVLKYAWKKARGGDSDAGDAGEIDPSTVTVSGPTPSTTKGYAEKSAAFRPADADADVESIEDLYRHDLVQLFDKVQGNLVAPLEAADAAKCKETGAISIREIIGKVETILDTAARLLREAKQDATSRATAASSADASAATTTTTSPGWSGAQPSPGQRRPGGGNVGAARAPQPVPSTAAPTPATATSTTTSAGRRTPPPVPPRNRADH